jgi:23S rRNA (uracil1939-C5)-methyltransferase
MDAELFFQGNLAMQERLVEDLLFFADKGERAADIYCGVGVFALFLARRYKTLDLVDGEPRALALARENMLRLAGFETCPPACNYAALSAEKWAAGILARAESAADGTGRHRLGGSESIPRWDFFVADPPRAGLAPSLVRLLGAARPKTFAYISCDPATLARDSRKLRELGFKLAALRLYDFYPQTMHIECMAVFAA